MRKWIAAVIAMFSVAVLAPSAPAQAAVTNPGDAIAILSTQPGCGGSGTWSVTLTLYSNLTSGGNMRVYPSSAGTSWNPSGTIASTGYFYKVVYMSSSIQTAYFGASLYLTRNGLGAFRSAYNQSQNPGC